MKNKRRQQGYTTLDLIEEAVHLLRTTPMATLAIYYLGTMPFVLGFLFFWADMSRDPFASGHLADASLGMGILFVWMKFWQAVFSRRVRAQRAALPLPRARFRQIIRTLLIQLVWQPSGLFLIPLSLVPVVPFAWVYAFYQNITALDDGEAGAREVFKKSWRQAGLWPGPNNLAILILIGFGSYVFANLATVTLALPELAKMLLGIQSKYTESPMSLLNSTFFAAMFGLTYLCVDPILKAFYTLRCFYGESLESGEDLKAELKDYAATISRVAAAILFVSFVAISRPAIAADAAPAAGASPVSGVSLGNWMGPSIKRFMSENMFGGCRANKSRTLTLTKEHSPASLKRSETCSEDGEARFCIIWPKDSGPFITGWKDY